MRSALLNLQMPQVICTRNENTGKSEVSLAEDMKEEDDKTDELVGLKDKGKIPYLVSFGYTSDSKVAAEFDN